MKLKAAFQVLTGSFDLCGGQFNIDWTFTDACGRTITHSQRINIEPTPAPQWNNRPLNRTVTCEEAADIEMVPLTYNNARTNECQLLGTVQPQITYDYNACGGTVISFWEYTDPCGRYIQYSQTITVEPAAEPQWIDPPIDITLNCNEAENWTAADLTYSNGAIGLCAIEGVVSPEVTRNYDACGGSITAVWTFTDECGRVNSHTQNITVEPAAAPDWINPPADLTITCDEAAGISFSDLLLDNGPGQSCTIAGRVSASVTNNYDACGGTIEALWSYTDACGRVLDYTQTITVEPAPLPEWLNPPPAAITVTCAEADNLVLPEINYSNAAPGTCIDEGSVPAVLSGTYDACGGTLQAEWIYTDDCGRSINYIQEISVEPAAAPDWISPPIDITLSCADAQNYSPPSIFYTNGADGSCEISGEVAGTISGSSADVCGGSFVVEWNYTDDCGHTLYHSQTVTVLEAAPPQWVNPPEDLEMDCEAAAAYVVPDLEFSNNEGGGCEISGFASGSSTGYFDNCGGSLSIEWEYTDDCGRQITHTQNILVKAANLAQWVNPPGDINLTCEEADRLEIPDLEFNNFSGSYCEISGVASGTLSGTYDKCGGYLEIQWDFTDLCGSNISHVQRIFVLPARRAEWVNPPDHGQINCAQAAAYVFPDLEVSNNAPGVCPITGTVSPVVNESYDFCGGFKEAVWTFTDDCGRSISHTQRLAIIAADEVEWVDPPTETLSIACTEAADFIFPDLAYANDPDAVCHLEGISSPVVTRDFDVCGGTVTAVWSFTDPCGRLISHSQTAVVEPAPEPAWINPPADTIITCAEAPGFSFADLSFTNALEGTCAIGGLVSPQITEDYGSCGGKIVAVWSHTDACGRSMEYQQMVEVLPAEAPVWENPEPTAITISCEAAEGYVVPAMTYSNPASGSCLDAGSVQGILSGSFDACGGTLFVEWNYTDACDRSISHLQTLTVEPAPVASWINPPPDITISCAEAQNFSAPDLAFSNGLSQTCEIAGQVPGVVSGNTDPCGSSFVVEWTYTDACDRTIMHSQTVTVAPAPNPEWIALPADRVVTCTEAAQLTIPELSFTNGAEGNCEIAGTVSGSSSGSFDVCGGALVFSWEYTDPCGKVLSHSQSISIEPAPAPKWINPPADTLISCEAASGFLIPDLAFSNALDGSCSISGQVSPEISGEYDVCGGTLTAVWNHTSPCGEVISHTQQINVSPAAAPDWVNPPADITISCSEADNFVFGDLEISNGSEAVCSINAIMAAELTRDYDVCGGTIVAVWSYTDPCGRAFSRRQNVTVLPAPEPQWVELPPAEVSITCPEAASYVFSDLAFSNNLDGTCAISGVVAPVITRNYTNCGGTMTAEWTYENSCGSRLSYTQTVNVLPVETLTWENLPPATVSISCEESVDFAFPDLTYTNGETGVCAITGSVAAVFSVQGNGCQRIIRATWNYAGDCGNELSYTQEVLVEPDRPSEWLSVPADTVKLSCEEALAYAFPNLEYTNGSAGLCLVSGTVAPEIMDFDVECGGFILAEWSFDDPCFGTNTVQQFVIIEPPINYQWIDPPPAEITISCEEAAGFQVPELMFTNGADGACFESGTVAGIKTGGDNTCGSQWTIEWTYTAVCGKTINYTQIVNIQPAPAPEWVNPPPSAITITCAAADNFVVPEMSLTNGGTGICLIEETVSGTRTGSYDVCGGAWEITWTYTDACGRTMDYRQQVDISPAAPANWLAPPADTALTCEAYQSYLATSLAYANEEAGSCTISGSAAPVIQSDYDVCGGQVNISWEAEDPCGNVLTHNQFITILPAPEPEWVNPPTDASVSCVEAEEYDFPELLIANMLSDLCGIRDTVAPVVTKDYNSCGGAIEATWTYSDPCGRVFTHRQIVTVAPAPAPEWVNLPPMSVTVDCSAADSLTFPDLAYTNALSGICEVSGSVSPQVTRDYGNCGGNIVVAWRYTDDCGNDISHQQTVEVLPIGELTWLDIPPLNLNLSCSESVDYTFPVLQFTNGESGSCAIMGSVEPIVAVEGNDCQRVITATWVYEGACGVLEPFVQQIFVEPDQPADWIDAPGDTLFLSCEAALNYDFPNLSYGNNAQGWCIIEGEAVPVVTDVDLECGGYLLAEWTFFDPCFGAKNARQVIVIEPPINYQWMNPPPSEITLTCEEAQNYVIPELAFTNGGTGTCAEMGTVAGVKTGDDNTCGSQWTIEWTYTAICGTVISYQQTVTIEPAVLPEWINPPSPELSISCLEAADFVIPDLRFSNNASGLCLIEGSVAGQRRGSYDICGGNWIIDWVYSDPCGREITYTQNVNIDPAPVPGWINPPGDTLLSCSAVDRFTAESLLLSNERNGSCSIEALIKPVVTNNYDDCGGSILVDWEWDSPCGEKWSYRQTITVIPLPDPEWINPPANTSISCEAAAAYEAPVLAYAGGTEEGCTVEGVEEPLVERNYNECGGEIVVTWTYTSPCRRITTYQQVITVEPLTEPQLINLPAAKAITCAEADDFVPDTLEYSNFSEGSCLIAGVAVPQRQDNFDACGGTITVTWELPGICAEAQTFTQTIEVLPAPLSDWLILPVDTTLAYADATGYTGYELPYSNEDVACPVEGLAGPTDFVRNFSICGGTMQLEWRIVSVCGDSLQALQNISVEPAPAPEVDLSSAATLICENDYLVITPKVTNAFPDMDFRWEYSTDGLNFEPIPAQRAAELNWGPLLPSDEGFVRLVYGKEAGGDLKEDCLFVSPPLAFRVVPRSVEQISQTICAGEHVNFDGLQLSATGTYIDTLGSLNGCDSIIVLNLEVLPLSESILAESICEGESITFGGETLTSAGVYQQVLTAANGCDSVVNLELSVHPSSEEILNFELCTGDTLRILDQVITEATTFTGTFSNANGCDSTVTYIVSAMAPPEYSFVDYYICPGEKVTLKVESEEPIELSWQASPSLSCTDCDTPVAKPAQTTDYVFSVQSCTGETLFDTITVYVTEPPQLVALEDITLAEGESVEVSLQSADNRELYSIRWMDEEGNLLCDDCVALTVTSDLPDRIFVAAENEWGCRSEISFELFRSFGPCQDDQIEVSNAMTLNNDGVNEFMEIKNQGRATINSVQVYTRWGELIFSTNDPSVKWNGTIAGEPVNQGVYVYVIRGTCANGKDPFIRDGNITVLR